MATSKIRLSCVSLVTTAVQLVQGEPQQRTVSLATQQLLEYFALKLVNVCARTDTTMQEFKNAYCATTHVRPVRLLLAVIVVTGEPEEPLLQFVTVLLSTFMTMV